MTLLGILVAALAVPILGGCGASIPSDEQARQVVDKSFAGLKDIGAKTVDFRKLNGESLEQAGQKVYVYHFLAAAELPAGVAWVKAFDGGFIKGPGSRGFGLLETVSLPQGTTAARRGQITFRLTERGWVSEDLPDTSTDGYCTQLKPDACYKQLGWDKPK